MSDVRCALAGAWRAVRARRVGQFPRVLRVVEAVEAAAPSALRYRHRARLRLGLRAAVLVQMLREARPEPDLYDAVDRFFPEGGPRREEAAVQEAQEGFRDLVLELLQDPERRHAFLMVEAPQEYGPRFLSSLERLFHELLLRVESALPPPDLPQLQALVWSHAPPGAPRSDLPILRQYLADVSHAHRGAVPRPLRPKPRLRLTSERDDVISDEEGRVLKRKPRFPPKPPRRRAGMGESKPRPRRPPIGPRRPRSLPIG